MGGKKIKRGARERSRGTRVEKPAVAKPNLEEIPTGPSGKVRGNWFFAQWGRRGGATGKKGGGKDTKKFSKIPSIHAMLRLRSFRSVWGEVNLGYRELVLEGKRRERKPSRGDPKAVSFELKRKGKEKRLTGKVSAIEKEAEVRETEKTTEGKGGRGECGRGSVKGNFPSDGRNRKRVLRADTSFRAPACLGTKKREGCLLSLVRKNRRKGGGDYFKRR